MRFSVKFVCALVLAVYSVSPSAAQEPLFDEGAYFSFGGGISDGTFAANHLGMEVLEADLTTTIYDFQNTYAVTAIGAFGYTWAPVGYAAQFRVELEGSYRRAFFDQVVVSNYCQCGSPNSQTIQTAEGYLENIAAMIDGYVDFRIGDTNFTPYFGAGVGATRLARRDAIFDGRVVTGKFTYASAWQVMGGLGYRLSSGIIVGLEFRHFETGDIDFEGVLAPQQYYQQDIMFTIRLVG